MAEEDVDDHGVYGFVEVLDENKYFQTVFEQYSDVKNFLKRHERIYARSVSAEYADQDVFLDFETDLDGCVIELKSLNCIKLPVRHLTILPEDMRSVHSIYPMLKKHINLSLYTQTKLTNLRRSVGIQLFYERGWECWLGVVPRLNTPDQHFEQDVIKVHSFQFFHTLKKTFQSKLGQFALSERARKTLMKNDLGNLRKIFVLPGDSETILCGLQQSIDECSTHSDFQTILFCFRFGEKCQGSLSFEDFKASEIRSITVHSAVDISSEYMHLFWSTSGLQRVANRGILSPCLSFADCGNFQSNLDGRLLDISKDLRCVCNHPAKIRFVQLYSDLPHLRPKTRYHPVSGCISSGTVLPARTAEAFKRDAHTYISALWNNVQLMTKSTCRIEYVTELVEIPKEISACDTLSLKRLSDLLVKIPLLVPFPPGMMSCVQKIGELLINELKLLLLKFQATGNVEATWQAFQYELAAEKLMWGHPFCILSQQMSVNLGPGKLEPGRSLTDYKGFLALEQPTSCMSDEDSIPSGRIWTASEQTARRIRRFAGLHDVLNGGSFVLGRRLVDVLLGDLFEEGKLDRYLRFEHFKHELFSEKPNMFSVTGAVTMKQLTHILCNRERRLSPSMIFGSSCRMIQNSGKDLVVILKDGLSNLKYFPAIQVHDSHRHPILRWSTGSGVWKIIGQGESVSEAQCASTLSKLVTSELELRGIVYVSKLKKLPVVFPWICVCKRKLSALRLTDEGLLLVLCFVSCIALLMNGWYVEYVKLEKLLNDMHVPQSRLREVEVLSKLQLSHFNKFSLFRLHNSIPFRLNELETQSVSKKESEKAEDKGFEPISEELDVCRITENDDFHREADIGMVARVPTCVPQAAVPNFPWAPEELEVLHEVSMGRGQNDTKKSLYDIFKERCMQKGIPFRNFISFKNKLERL